jgi:D-alanine-D-alanine ligase
VSSTGPRGIRSIAIVTDLIATGDAASAETGAAEASAVASIVAVAADVAAIAESLGATVETIDLPAEPRALLRALADVRAELVVNLAESWAGKVRYETAIGWLLELLGLPYTGAPPRALALCLEKPLARAVLADAGVPVPRGVVLDAADAALELEALGAPPWIVKPASQDASHGIDATSVVVDEPALRARVAHLVERGIGPALVETYIDGRELNVAIVELDGAPPRALPIAEIDFTRFPAGLPRILTFASKWREDSEEYRGSTSVAAVGLAPGARERIEEVALAAWRTLGLRDYGRVDLRLDAGGAPYVIDVNPNPDLSRGAGLSLAAERAGIPHDRLIAGILRGAHGRRAA